MQLVAAGALNAGHPGGDGPGATEESEESVEVAPQASASRGALGRVDRPCDHPCRPSGEPFTVLMASPYTGYACPNVTDPTPSASPFEESVGSPEQKNSKIDLQIGGSVRSMGKRESCRGPSDGGNPAGPQSGSRGARSLGRAGQGSREPGSGIDRVNSSAPNRTLFVLRHESPTADNSRDHAQIRSRRDL